MNISDDIESNVPFLYRQCRNKNIGMMQVILQQMDRDRSRLLQQLNQKVGLISCDFLKAVANSGVDVDVMALFCRD
jgi:hypothetical protein